MPPDTAERRPAEEAPPRTPAKKSDSSLNPLDDIARYVDGTFVVVVQVTAGRFRRRCYLTAKAAESAARKAVHRGETATVFLAELKPLWKVRGGER